MSTLTWPDHLHVWLVGTKRTPPELAALMGVSARTVNRWLSGEATPDGPARKKLSALGAPVPEGAKHTGERVSSAILRQLQQIDARLERIEKNLTGWD